MLTKPWLEHLRERLTTLDEQVAYLSACHDEGPDTFELGLRDVLGIERQAGADAARREDAEIARASSAAKAKGDHGEGWNNALAYVEEVILARIGKPVDINRHHELEGE